MIEIFTGISHNSGKSAYKTERFCTLVDHNIILSVEINTDGSERKICHDIHACKNKDKCRYYVKPQKI